MVSILTQKTVWLGAAMEEWMEWVTADRGGNRALVFAGASFKYVILFKTSLAYFSRKVFYEGPSFVHGHLVEVFAVLQDVCI